MLTMYSQDIVSLKPACPVLRTLQLHEERQAVVDFSFCLERHSLAIKTSLHARIPCHRFLAHYVKTSKNRIIFVLFRSYLKVLDTVYAHVSGLQDSTFFFFCFAVRFPHSSTCARVFCFFLQPRKKDFLFSWNRRRHFSFPCNY